MKIFFFTAVFGYRFWVEPSYQLGVNVSHTWVILYLDALRAMSSAEGSWGFSVALAMMSEIFWMQSPMFLCWLLLCSDVTSNSPALLIRFLFCSRRESKIIMHSIFYLECHGGYCSGKIEGHKTNLHFDRFEVVNVHLKWSFVERLLGSNLLYRRGNGPLLLCWLWRQTDSKSQ